MKSEYDLNDELLEAVRSCDIHKAEELLKQGADPLGSADERDPREHLLGELFCEMEDNNEMAKMMPDFLKLFYEYGMDIGACKMTSDEKNGLNPLWALSFCDTEEGLKTLYAMLEHGLDVDSAEQLVDHILMDMEMCDGCLMDDWSMRRRTCSLKMVMFVASYPEILNKSPYIQSCIALSKNDSKKLPAFRKWDDFDYCIDISTCTNIPHGLCDATLTIRNKLAHEQVWEMVI